MTDKSATKDPVEDLASLAELRRLVADLKRHETEITLLGGNWSAVKVVADW
jgi:hypothetical protein